MKALDKLVRNPRMTLSFDRWGKEVWSTKPPLESVSISHQRAVWENVVDGVTTDDVILQILKRNSGTEAQLYNFKGTFPYIAIHANGRKNEEMVLPNGVSIHEDALWLKFQRKSAEICLAELLK